MHDYAEKRDFQRMAMECPARFRMHNAEEINGAIVKDLSSGGMLLWLEQEIAVGERLNIEVMPAKAITPSLSAEATIIRCYELEDGIWAAACSIENIFREEEVGVSFP
jgi:hypothetical protein